MPAPADRDALLRAMDLNCWEMFRDIARACRGAEVLDLPALTLIWAPSGTPFHNAVLVRGAVDRAAVEAAAARVFAPRGAAHSVWVRAHADAVLEADLRAAGYETFTSMPGMVLRDDPGTPCAPAGLEIRAAVDERGRDDFRQVSAAAYATYGAPAAYADDAFARRESVCAPHIQGFVGYAAGAPVAAAAVYVTHGVAGIGWVGCTPPARGRRYAEAVTWTALREGLRRGATFTNLQASPMGRPVYARMGFETPTEYRVLIPPLA